MFSAQGWRKEGQQGMPSNFLLGFSLARNRSIGVRAAIPEETLQTSQSSAILSELAFPDVDPERRHQRCAT
jgi:hypothetical protein